MGSKKQKSAFTIVEILLVVSILFFISTFFLRSFLNIPKDYSSVQNDTFKIKSILETARNKALINESDSDWGVYFVGSSSSYYLFSSTTFASSTNYYQYFLDENNIFLDPSSSSVKEIVFQRHTGYTNPATITISSFNGKVISNIFVNPFGNIDFEIKKQ